MDYCPICSAMHQVLDCPELSDEGTLSGDLSALGLSARDLEYIERLAVED